MNNHDALRRHRLATVLEGASSISLKPRGTQVQGSYRLQMAVRRAVLAGIPVHQALAEEIADVKKGMNLLALALFGGMLSTIAASILIDRTLPVVLMALATVALWPLANVVGARLAAQLRQGHNNP